MIHTTKQTTSFKTTLFPSLAAMSLFVVTLPTMAADNTLMNPTTTAPMTSAPATGPITWGDNVWNLQLDPTSGALVHLENRTDPQHMNWLREAGRWEHRDWLPDTSPEAVTLDGQWGLVETAHTGLLHVARVHKISDRVVEAVYTSASLTVTVRRELNASDELTETYTLKNTGVVAMNLPLGSVSIATPFFDQYPDAKLALAERCHTHVWMGGNSAWINATRMGAKAPHLGLVVTQGSLDAYSQKGGTFNDRGVFLLHPGAMKIERGQSATIAWKLFWHTGWDDFFSKLQATNGFVRLTATDYTVAVGQPLQISAESATPLETAQVFANGQLVQAQSRGGHLTATIPTTQTGEVLVELRQGAQKTCLRANVTPAIDDLIGARVKFIVRKQQRNDPGSPLDGAYLSFDNETDQQVYDPKWDDHNAGRERVAMGVIGALYLPICHDEAFKTELKQSLSHYATFVARELEDDNGVVYDGVGRKGTHRLYNCPWMARFHLAMYHATGEFDHLNRFVRVMRNFYKAGGAKQYSIELPIFEGLNTLEKAGRTQERAELLGLFQAHADSIVHNGANYPRFEVNYEQSIVAPALQILSEMYAVTNDERYLDVAKEQMPLLEAFCGQQPDFHLNEVGIRHWDDYWFGKIQVYGDTMPHYWSTLNAIAYAFYGRGTGDASWFKKADTCLGGNLSLFNPDGSASAAHLYALTTNGLSGAKNDPWANDQDWALVNVLTVRAIPKTK